ncbi:unnamed protein product, partial [Owenia fusiformis]
TCVTSTYYLEFAVEFGDCSTIGTTITSAATSLLNTFRRHLPSFSYNNMAFCDDCTIGSFDTDCKAGVYSARAEINADFAERLEDVNDIVEEKLDDLLSGITGTGILTTLGVVKDEVSLEVKSVDGE